MKNGNGKPSNKLNTQLRKALKELGVQPPGSSTDVVRQRHLEKWDELRAKYKEVDKELADFRAEVNETIKGGAKIQPGQFGAKTSIHYRRNFSRKKVIIDELGQDFYDKQLQKAPVHAYFHVRLVVPKK